MKRDRPSALPEIRLAVPVAVHAELKRRAQLHDRTIIAETLRAIRFYLARYDDATELLQEINRGERSLVA